MATTNRIHGYDLARAFAIIGMIVAHFTPGDFPGEWLSHGYPSALFAVLVGVSSTIILTNRPQLATCYGYSVRASLILLLGVLLSSLPSMIMVVLTTIAVEMLVLVLIHHWSTRRLSFTLIILVLLSPAVSGLLSSFGHDSFLNSVYPLLAWIAYGIGGILLHRLLQARARMTWVVLAVGAIAVAAAYPLRGSSADFEWLKPGSSDPKNFTEPTFAWVLQDYFSIAAHSGGLLDLLTTLLGSAAMIALCILLCRWNPLVMLAYPLRAVGVMPLTIYTFHVISEPFLTSFFGNESIAKKKSDVDEPVEMPWEIYQDKVARADGYPQFWDKEESWWEGSYDADTGSFTDEVFLQTGEFWVTVIVALVFASLWKIWARRGPLEWALASTVRAVVNSTKKAHAALLADSDPRQPHGDAGKPD